MISQVFSVAGIVLSFAAGVLWLKSARVKIPDLNVEFSLDGPLSLASIRTGAFWSMWAAFASSAAAIAFALEKMAPILDW